MKATFNGAVIAESDATIVVEGNHYFPPDAVNMEYLHTTGNQYTCPWKGVCDYYDVIVGDQTAAQAAWMYPQPSLAAQKIAGRFAFWKQVTVGE